MALSDISRRVFANFMLSRPEAEEICNAIDGVAPATPAAVATSPGTAGTSSTQSSAAGGSTSIATTGVGGAGGGRTTTLGTGGSATAAATAATGGAGGPLTVTTGAGGPEAVATVTSTGGAGGAYTFTTGVGGAVSGAVSGTATGGAAGAISLLTGVGGAVTATTGTNVGGASGAVTIGSGVGGAASGATDTGGASGAVIIKTGTGGAGDTGGASGSITIQTGAAGAGGSPAVGVININPGAANKWIFDATGNFYSTASVANVTADGAIVATGGIAFTDVLNAWIDDATHGSGTTSILIGNQTITTSSDSRIKKNVADFKGSALDVLAKAPRVVTFEYDHPNWGGTRAAKSDKNGQLYGPNARGQFVGFIAQELIDSFPSLVNAGAGKECKNCRAGKACDNPDHSFWTVEYQHMVPLLLKAVMELQEQINELRKGKQ